MKTNQNEVLTNKINYLTVDYEQKDVDKLHKIIITEEQLMQFEQFDNMLKKKYTSHLITNLYIKYNNNIKNIVRMNNKLKTIGAITPAIRHNISVLNTMVQLIRTEKDFEQFSKCWKEYNKEHDIMWILGLYRDKNTPDRCC